MQVIIPTSNKYTHIIEPNVKLLNKYWPGQDITVLAYSTEGIGDLPDNVRVVSLGNQDDFGPYWTNGLIPFFEQYEHHHFALILDDMMLCAPVNQEAIDDMLPMLAGNFASKIMIHSHLNHAYGEHVPYKRYIKISDRATYRTSLHPAIWSRDYLLKYLKPDMTPWEFELGNEKAAQDDGHTILSWPSEDHRMKHVFPCLDIYRKGVLSYDNYWGLGHPTLETEDKELLEQYV